MNNILMTGGTGFLGSEMIKELLLKTDSFIYALVRGRTRDEAEQRLYKTLDHVSGGIFNDDIYAQRIRVVRGDIAERDLGISQEERDELIRYTDIICNNAAVTDLNMPIKVIREINVYGTRNVLDLAKLCAASGRLRKVDHISTAYIAGKEKRVFRETDLDIGQDFNNTYEQSKFEAELLVNEYRKEGLKIDIYRPGIILGRYTDGMTTNFKMFYQPLHFFARGLFEKIPAIRESCPNLINIDTTAKAIVRISGKVPGRNRNYHIVSPHTVSFRFALSVAAEYFGFKMPEFVNPERVKMNDEYTAAQRNLIKSYLPYFNYMTRFEMGNTHEALSDESFLFPRFDKANFMRIYEYCDKKGFIKKKANNAVIK